MKILKGILCVNKRELPLSLVIEDDAGQQRVLELAPAREGKLGAFLRDAGKALVDSVKRSLRQ